MKNLTTWLFKNPLISSGLIVLLGSNVYNITQFIYHFLAGRFLGKAFYSDLAVILTILGIIGVVQQSLGLTIVKWITSEKNQTKKEEFIKWVFSWSIKIGLGVGLLTILVSPILTSFLNLTQPLSIYILGPIILFFVLVNVIRSILQGLIKFNQYVVSLLSEGFIKVLFTIILIFWGYAVSGALFALLLSLIAAFIFSKFFINKYLNSKLIKDLNVKKLFDYSIYTLIQGVFLTSMYSIDLILVKHFFSAEESGIFAAVSVLGRIVLFGIVPLSTVMFPIISKRYFEKENFMGILNLSLILAIIFSLVLISFYYFYPNLAVNLLYGHSFMEAANYLWIYGIFMGLMGISILLSQFYLSIGKVRVVWFIVICSIFQILLIWFSHKTLTQVMINSILSAALLVICLFVYLPYLSSKKNVING